MYMLYMNVQVYVCAPMYVHICKYLPTYVTHTHIFILTSLD